MGSPDKFQPDVIALHQFQFLLEVGLQQLHQELDFARRTAQEILCREGIKREGRQPDAGGRLSHIAYGFHAALVAGNTWQMATFGPAAVAVHDDGDMFRELVGIQLAEEFSFFPVQF